MMNPQYNARMPTAIYNSRDVEPSHGDVNNYFLTVMAPGLYGGIKVPDYNIDATTTKKTITNFNFQIPSETYGETTPFICWLFVPHNLSFQLQVWVYWPGHSSFPHDRWHFVTVVEPSEILGTNYERARLVSGSLSLQSASIATGGAPLSGTFEGVCFQQVPDFLTTFETLTPLAIDERNLIATVPAAEGIIALALPDTQSELQSCVNKSVVSSEVTYESYSTTPHVAAPGGTEVIIPLNQILFGGAEVAVDLAWTFPSNGLGLARATVQLVGSVYNPDTQTIVSQSIGLVETTSAGDNIAGTSYTSNFFKMLNEPYICPVDAIRLVLYGQATISAVAGIRVGDLEGNARGFVRPGTAIIQKTMAANSTTTVAMVLNYEVVPNRRLAPDVKITTGASYINTSDFLVMKQLLSRRSAEPRIKTLYSLYEYKCLMNERFFERVAQRAQLETIAKASGWVDVAKGFLDVAAPVMAMIPGLEPLSPIAAVASSAIDWFEETNAEKPKRKFRNAHLRAAGSVDVRSRDFSETIPEKLWMVSNIMNNAFETGLALPQTWSKVLNNTDLKGTGIEEERSRFFVYEICLSGVIKVCQAFGSKMVTGTNHRILQGIAFRIEGQGKAAMVVSPHGALSVDYPVAHVGRYDFFQFYELGMHYMNRGGNLDFIEVIPVPDDIAGLAAAGAVQHNETTLTWSDPVEKRSKLTVAQVTAMCNRGTDPLLMPKIINSLKGVAVIPHENTVKGVVVGNESKLINLVTSTRPIDGVNYCLFSAKELDDDEPYTFSISANLVLINRDAVLADESIQMAMSILNAIKISGNENHKYFTAMTKESIGGASFGLAWLACLGGLPYGPVISGMLTKDAKFVRSEQIDKKTTFVRSLGLPMIRVGNGLDDDDVVGPGQLTTCSWQTPVVAPNNEGFMLQYQVAVYEVTAYSQLILAVLSACLNQATAPYSGATPEQKQRKTATLVRNTDRGVPLESKQDLTKTLKITGVVKTIAEWISELSEEEQRIVRGMAPQTRNEYLARQFSKKQSVENPNLPKEAQFNKAFRNKKKIIDYLKFWRNENENPPAELVEFLDNVDNLFGPDFTGDSSKIYKRLKDSDGGEAMITYLRDKMVHYSQLVTSRQDFSKRLQLEFELGMDTQRKPVLLSRTGRKLVEQPPAKSRTQSMTETVDFEVPNIANSDDGEYDDYQ